MLCLKVMYFFPPPSFCFLSVEVLSQVLSWLAVESPPFFFDNQLTREQLSTN